MTSVLLGSRDGSCVGEATAKLTGAVVAPAENLTCVGHCQAVKLTTAHLQQIHYHALEPVKAHL